MKAKLKVVPAPAEANRIISDSNEHRDLFTALSKDTDGFKRITQIILDLTGIFYPDNEKNRMLLASRFSSFLRQYGLKNYHELSSAIVSNPNSNLVQDVVCSVTTNTTHFFREGQHFDVLKTHIQEKMASPAFRAKPQVRVWCAACSTGQEIYSILFLLLEMGLGSFEVSLQLLATDIDTGVLTKAVKGIYTEAEVKSLPPGFKEKYFEANPAHPGESWVVKRRFRDMVHFAIFNLITDKPQFKEKFDVIFCRNVLIYFERETAERVVKKLSGELGKGGCLFLGHSETLAARGLAIPSIYPAVYKKEAA